MKIYTKGGDEGITSTYRGKRVSKSSLQIRANGVVDELNSFIGIILADLEYGQIQEKLIRIQNELFELGADISFPDVFEHISRIKPQDVEKLELEIDEWEKTLPKLKSFILPGGSKTGSQLHYARSICRRAEREVVAYMQTEKTYPIVVQYLNRLSDWFFVLARYVNLLANQTETKFISNRKS